MLLFEEEVACEFCSVFYTVVGEVIGLLFFHLRSDYSLPWKKLELMVLHLARVLSSQFMYNHEDFMW